MLVHELILGRYDIDYDSNSDSDEFSLCLGESEFEIINWKK